MLTSRKENPLVETILVSPKPAGDQNNTILAAWPYGLGKAVAFTSDDGGRWTQQWPGEPAYDKLFGQMIRWAMRPAGGTEKFTTATRSGRGADPRGGQRPGQERRVPQFPGMTATVVGPDLKAGGHEDGADRAGPLRRRAAGRRLRQLFHRRRPRRRPGPHPHRRDRALLRRIPRPGDQRRPAGPTGRVGAQGGRGGQGDRGRRPRPAPWSNWPRSTPSATICLKATSRQDIWHYLVLLACCLFFGDVFIRRVQVNLAWVPPLAGRARDCVLRRRPPPAAPPTMDRLRSRKAEVSGQFEQLRAAARFEAPLEQAAGLDALEERLPGRRPARRRRHRHWPSRSRKKKVIRSGCSEPRRRCGREERTRDQGPGTRD